MRRIHMFGVVLSLLSVFIQTADGDEPEIATLEAGNRHHVNLGADRYFTVRDPYAYSFLYAWLNGEPSTPPPVDFRSNVVVAGFLTGRSNGCYRLSLDRIETQNDRNRRRVYLVAHEPQPDDICTMATVQPYLLARIPVTRRMKITVMVNDRQVYSNEVRLRDLIALDHSRRHPARLQTVPAAQTAALARGRCPLDGRHRLIRTSLLQASPLRDRGIGGVASYCGTHGRYWIRKTHGRHVGPFTPGEGYDPLIVRLAGVYADTEGEHNTLLGDNSEEDHLSRLPRTVRESYEFYTTLLRTEDADWAGVSINTLRMTGPDRTYYWIYFGTDGDEKVLEVYDATGRPQLFGASRDAGETFEWYGSGPVLRREFTAWLTSDSD